MSEMMLPRVETPVKSLAALILAPIFQKITLNAVCLSANDPACFELIASQLSESRVLASYAHRGATSVRRYDLPLLPAMNFVIDDVLEGGVNGSLDLDGHGKSNSYILLGITVEVPAKYVRHPV